MEFQLVEYLKGLIGPLVHFQKKVREEIEYRHLYIFSHDMQWNTDDQDIANPCKIFFLKDKKILWNKWRERTSWSMLLCNTKNCTSETMFFSLDFFLERKEENSVANDNSSS